MIRRIHSALKKDCIEYLRKKYNIKFSLVSLTICIGVLASTIMLPNAINMLADRRPELMYNINSIKDLLLKLFPRDAKGNLCTVVSDFCMFYSLLVILNTYKILPNEIEECKWLMPLLCGYNKSELLFSKCLVFGIGVSLPVVIFTIIYYDLATFIFTSNLSVYNAITYALIIGLIEFSICVITISLSVIFNHSIVVAASVIFVIYTVPDILNYLSFGKLLPTYLFTYIYSYMTDPSLIIVPAIELIIITVFCFVLAINMLKSKAI